MLTRTAFSQISLAAKAADGNVATVEEMCPSLGTVCFTFLGGNLDVVRKTSQRGCAALT